MGKDKTGHFTLMEAVETELCVELAMQYGDLEMLYMEVLEKAELRLELIRLVHVVDVVHMRTQLENKTLLTLQ
jgi:hypothetical protein